jgi:hypothetical protein
VIATAANAAMIQVLFLIPFPPGIVIGPPGCPAPGRRNPSDG